MSGLSKVTVNVGKDGLGRRAPNKDKISGLLFFSASLPAGFSSTNRVQKVLTLSDAETLGIAEGSANFDVHWYHISEYFRMNPEGELWLGYFAVPGGSYDFAEITSMAIKANGDIRQLGVYANALTYATSQLTTIQAIIDALPAAYKQLSVIYAANMSAVTAVSGWATIGDVRALTAKKVTPIAAESGSGAGLALATAKAYSISSLGTALGVISRASVQQSIGNPQNFNLSDGIELEVPALANGDLVSALTDSQLGALKDLGYLVARKYIPDISGTYFERAPTAIAATSDYAWLETNRTIDKAIRGVRTALVPQLQATLLLNSDGTLRNDTVGYFQDLAKRPLEDMLAADEISAMDVLIDPTQNVLSTSTLTITVKIVPVGIAEQIVVNIGLTTAI